ncbi:hypothetical protein ABZV29_40020, partial [Streptomyces sp. NPDC005236]|uniref:hypothetical protein n=1 Tax=Streptomyces sp. NPDC005236 TaxID=3157028 RepID=UPI0033AEAF42
DNAAWGYPLLEELGGAVAVVVRPPGTTGQPLGPGSVMDDDRMQCFNGAGRLAIFIGTEAETP